MIEKWIDEFHSTNSKIERAIVGEDSARLRELDGEAQSLWGKIVTYQPKNPQERLLMATFLLDNLIGVEDASTVNRQIKEKLLALVKD